MFFVPLAMQRNERGVVAVGVREDWAGGREQRRRLIEPAVIATEDPVEFWNAYGRTEAWGGDLLFDLSIETALPYACIQGQPGCCLEGVGKVFLVDAAVDGIGFIDGCRATAIVEDGAEAVVIVLLEEAEAGLEW